MSNEPDNLVLQLWRGIRAEAADMATREELAELRSEVQSLRADAAANLVLMEARLSAEDKTTRVQIGGLRRAGFRGGATSRSAADRCALGWRRFAACLLS